MRPTPDKCLLAVLSYNNGGDLETTLSRIGPDFPFKVVVHIDGSTDGSDGCLKNYPYEVIRNPQNCGTGRCIKNVLEYARANGFEAIAILPGNNKNDAQEIPRLFKPILDGEADYVQGSRYLPGGRYDHTPLFRLIMVKVHALLFTILTWKKCTDALEGMRAYKISLFYENTGEMNVWQDWLDKYEFETYVHYKVLQLGYKVVEVPVSKIYPENKKHILNKKGKHYSHIRPILDWWKIMRPLVFLLLRIKR